MVDISKSFEAAFQPLTVGQPPEHVTSIQDGRLVLSNKDSLPRRYGDDVELAQLVSDLIGRNVAFTDAGPGWHPGEVVRSLQERGLVTRAFVAIVWHGPGLFRTYEVGFRHSA